MSRKTSLPDVVTVIATPKEVSKRQHRLSLHIVFAVALLATALDASLSYLSISILGIATEGNPLLVGIAANLGFGDTMILRFAIGAVLLFAIYRIALATEGRSLASRGLYFVTLVLVLLTGYHALLLSYGLLV